MFWWQNDIILFKQAIGIAELAQTVTIVAAFGALYFSARAAFHTKVLKVSINGRMEKLIEATAIAAAAQAREEARAELILATVQEASEQTDNSVAELEQARKVGFHQGRIYEMDKARKHNRFRKRRRKRTTS